MKIACLIKSKRTSYKYSVINTLKQKLHTCSNKKNMNVLVKNYVLPNIWIFTKKKSIFASVFFSLKSSKKIWTFWNVTFFQFQKCQWWIQVKYSRKNSIATIPDSCQCSNPTSFSRFHVPRSLMEQHYYYSSLQMFRGRNITYPDTFGYS